MAQDVTIAGASYTDVPSVNLPKTSGGTATFLDSEEYRTAADQDVIDATKANSADLASVATSGNYNDLSNKPTIPTNTNQLTNGAGFITSSGSCNYATSAGSAGSATSATNANYATSAGSASSASTAVKSSGGSWISGRDNAVAKQTTKTTSEGSSWNPVASVKTSSGNWTIGNVGGEKLTFSYDTDSDYAAGRNTSRTYHISTDGVYSGTCSNADTTDGLHIHTGRNNEGNKIVRTDGNGYIQCGYINSSNGDEKNSSNPTYVWGTNGSDSYLRTYNTGYLRVNYANSAGSAPANGGTSTYTNYVNNDAASMRMHWNGQSGQPTWLWGANSAGDTYVWNPSNFSVKYASYDSSGQYFQNTYLYKPTLLWQNGSPTASFASQNISVSASSYSYILFQTNWGTNSTGQRGNEFAIYENGVAGSIHCIDYDTNQHVFRRYIIYSSYIYFGTGYISKDATYGTATNDRCIPYRIYGLK